MERRRTGPYFSSATISDAPQAKANISSHSDHDKDGADRYLARRVDHADQSKQTEVVPACYGRRVVSSKKSKVRKGHNVATNRVSPLKFRKCPWRQVASAAIE